MNKRDLFRVWGRILRGSPPFLSIEITRECPLRCPGCYAYEPEHLGQIGPLRTLADYKGQELIDRMLSLVHRQRPVHISIVGGEPLVRFRELDVLLPCLSEMGIEVLLVTSAVREIPRDWNRIKDLHIAVSIDGLQPEHDRRRAPATYERILKNIEGHAIRVHCTVTRQMASHPNAFEEFLSFWSSQPEVRKIWISLFTPQVGADDEETLSPSERAAVLEELARLRPAFPKLRLPDPVLDGLSHPPQSPDECLFARTTVSVTADLHSRITPCQLGGSPDCSRCGCAASAVIKAVSDHRLLGIVPVKSLYDLSERVGKIVSKMPGNSFSP